MVEAVKYGRSFKCMPCNSSYRFVRDNDATWNTMNAEQRRKAIVANRRENCKRGVARKLVASHKAGAFKNLNSICFIPA